MACYMALLVQLADKPEVLRVSPILKVKLLNAVGSAVVQSATTTKTPLHDAGLDGQGEVIQVSGVRRCLTEVFFKKQLGACSMCTPRCPCKGSSQPVRHFAATLAINKPRELLAHFLGMAT